MDYSYPTLYENYKKFAIDRDCPYWSYSEWLQKKDAPPKSKQQATYDFIKEMEKLVHTV